MKGAGEPVFEHDFPPGSDIVGQILSGPKAAERMEFELFGRLAAQREIEYSDEGINAWHEGMEVWDDDQHRHDRDRA